MAGPFVQQVLAGKALSLAGWSVGEANQSSSARDAASLYEKLETIVLPLLKKTAGH